jgi:L-threonylcarbamoyladenylate synthase
MVNFDNDIEQCLKVLRGGGLILYPTDTVWGIGCDATNEQAAQRVYRLKNRQDNNALIVLVAEERDVLQHIANPDYRIFEYLRETATKPTTVIYRNAIGLAENIVGKDGSIAIRICQDEFCRNLLKRFRKPIVSTSANISGKSAPSTFADIATEVKIGVDYVVNYRQDDTVPAQPSSLIKWNKDGTTTILRE